MNRPAFRSAPVERKDRNTPKLYSPEFKDRAIRMVSDHQCLEQTGAWTALVVVGGKLGVSPHTLRNWDQLARRAASSEAEARNEEPCGVEAQLRRLCRENVELRPTNEILMSASTFFAAELNRPTTS